MAYQVVFDVVDASGKVVAEGLLYRAHAERIVDEAEEPAASAQTLTIVERRVR